MIALTMVTLMGAGVVWATWRVLVECGLPRVYSAVLCAGLLYVGYVAWVAGDDVAAELLCCAAER